VPPLVCNKKVIIRRARLKTPKTET